MTVGILSSSSSISSSSSSILAGLGLGRLDGLRRLVDDEEEEPAENMDEPGGETIRLTRLPLVDEGPAGVEVLWTGGELGKGERDNMSTVFTVLTVVWIYIQRPPPFYC